MRTRTLLPLVLSALFVGQVPLQATADDPAQAQNAATPRTLSAREVFATWKDSVFTIKTSSSIGTGFAFGAGILTCHHVIKDASEVSAMSSNRPEKRLERVIALDEKVDAAYFFCPDTGAKPVEVGDEENLSVGDPLYVIGSPQGLEHTLTEGILSAKRTIGNLVYYQLSAAISPGSSGSPVFDKHGKVVGMVIGTIKDAQQLNFAISLASIRNTMQPGFDLKTVLRPAATDSNGNSLPSPSTAQKASVLWILELVARSSDPNRVRLGQAPDFSVRIVLNDVARALVSEETVRGWVLAELARSAPAAKVLTQAEREAAEKRLVEGFKAFLANPVGDPILFMETFMETWMAAFDQYSRTLSVFISSMRDETTGTIFWDVQVCFERSAILVSGIAELTGWESGSLGYFGAAHNPQDVLRRAVTGQVQKFCDSWVVANRKTR
ncbi:MAG: serine protease [Chloroherpetonaceae bacterium]|nr:serine protease [Chthonomonadaceae bacterium]MDW8208544.1 serine protease [Chloroherpetonaceae bacterium]